MSRWVLVGLLLPLELAAAATPVEGVPLAVRRGFFTETDLGSLFSVGGSNGYSDLAPYVQLGAGYQFSPTQKLVVPVTLNVAVGATTNCFAGFLPRGRGCAQADHFTMTSVSASAGVLYGVFERFDVGAKVMVGYALLDPAPLLTGTAPSDRAPVTQSPTVGAAATVEYSTSLDHFSVGFDLAWQYSLLPNIGSAAFLVRTQYTF